jgi:acyl-CoA synthetase (NDP forming)/GNAT superfamily N-acetyltransferase
MTPTSPAKLASDSLILDSLGSPAHRALLADGTTALVRRLTPVDRPAVEALHRGLPRQDAYLRFFSACPVSDRVAGSIVAEDVVAFGAFQRTKLVGVAHYRREPAGRDPEFAVVVAHEAQHGGIASLLLEHLVSVAALEGVRRLSAEVLAVNHKMSAVIHDSGLPCHSRFDGSVTHVVLDVPCVAGRRSTSAGEHYLDAVLARETSSEVASLRPLLEPRAVAVVGAGRRPGSVGAMVLRALVAGGYRGSLHAVNPHAPEISGVRCVPSVAELRAGIDLAVVCVPAAAVPEVAEQCGRRGIRGLLVISAGVSADRAIAAELAGVLERHGMRMVGPNCLGLVNTDPRVQLQATFAGGCTVGRVGIAAQSGGVVIGVAAELDRLGLGVSSAVSVGDAADVNGDDMLLWWGEDGRTDAAVLHLESVRRPIPFAQIAHRLASRIPVLTLRTGSSEAGRRAAASHSARGATPRVFRDALFDRAGVLAVDTLAELVEGLAVLCWQPLPAGPRVALLSNAGGIGVLAADACARTGLAVATLSPASTEALAGLLPAGASLVNPVDATATVAPETFAQALEVLVADPEVDAVVVLGVPTAAGDPLEGLRVAPPRRGTKPVVAVQVGQPVGVRRLSGQPVTGPADGATPPSAVPSFADPFAAARALSLAARRGRWLRRPAGRLTEPVDVHRARARAIVEAALRAHPDGGWLAPADAFGLILASGVPVAPVQLVSSAAEAVWQWRRVGGPVVLKADVPDVLHKSRAGAVSGTLDSSDQVICAYEQLCARFPGRLRGVVVQPMVAVEGPELLLGATVDPEYGALLTVGLGGTATDLLDDRAHCLTPAPRTSSTGCSAASARRPSSSSVSAGRPCGRPTGMRWRAWRGWPPRCPRSRRRRSTR